MLSHIYDSNEKCYLFIRVSYFGNIFQKTSWKIDSVVENIVIFQMEESELVSVSVPLDLARGDTVESMMTNVDVNTNTTYWNIAAQPSQVILV